MASRKIVEDHRCPFCKNLICFNKDAEYVQTKRRLKQYFHRSCYMKHVEEQRKLREERR